MSHRVRTTFASFAIWSEEIEAWPPQAAAVDNPTNRSAAAPVRHAVRSIWQAARILFPLAILDQFKVVTSTVP
jgi:hypothetical protein